MAHPHIEATIKKIKITSTSTTRYILKHKYKDMYFKYDQSMGYTMHIHDTKSLISAKQFNTLKQAETYIAKSNLIFDTEYCIKPVLLTIKLI